MTVSNPRKKHNDALVGSQKTYWVPPSFTSSSLLDKSLIRLLVKYPIFKGVRKPIISLASCMILLYSLLT